ncbi:MAG: tRNA(Ile2) C34 agmatinyltransferase TiaS [Oleiphilaceae bacterium]|jgi:tRNA(Ile2) C34 agmatinyltransferase TiaS
MGRLGDYPSNVRQFDTHQSSPFYVEEEEHDCSDCGETMKETHEAYFECTGCGEVLDLNPEPEPDFLL